MCLVFLSNYIWTAMLQENARGLCGVINPLNNCTTKEQVHTLVCQCTLTNSDNITANAHHANSTGENNMFQQYISDYFVPKATATLNAMVIALDDLESTKTVNSNSPLLSVQTLRVVYTAVELLWQWGINKAVLHNTHFPMPVASLPNALLVSKRTVDVVMEGTAHNAIPMQTILNITNCIRLVVTNDNFSGLMLQRNLDRVLLTYFWLSKTPSESSELVQHISETENLRNIAASSREALDLLQRSPFAPFVVTKLRAFTKGDAWLREASCQMLTNILVGNKGLEVVLSGYLEGRSYLQH